MLLQYIFMAIGLDLQEYYTADNLVYATQFVGKGNYTLFGKGLSYGDYIHLLRENSCFYSVLLDLQMCIWKKIKGYNWWKKIQFRKSDKPEAPSCISFLFKPQIMPVEDVDKYYMLYQIIYYFKARFYTQTYPLSTHKKTLGSFISESSVDDGKSGRKLSTMIKSNYTKQAQLNNVTRTLNVNS